MSMLPSLHNPNPEMNDDLESGMKFASQQQNFHVQSNNNFQGFGNQQNLQPINGNDLRQRTQPTHSEDQDQEYLEEQMEFPHTQQNQQQRKNKHNNQDRMEMSGHQRNQCPMINNGDLDMASMKSPFNYSQQQNVKDDPLLQQVRQKEWEIAERQQKYITPKIPAKLSADVKMTNSDNIFATEAKRNHRYNQSEIMPMKPKLSDPMTQSLDSKYCTPKKLEALNFNPSVKPKTKDSDNPFSCELIPLKQHKTSLNSLPPATSVKKEKEHHSKPQDLMTIQPTKKSKFNEQDYQDYSVLANDNLNNIKSPKTMKLLDKNSKEDMFASGGQENINQFKSPKTEKILSKKQQENNLFSFDEKQDPMNSFKSPKQKQILTSIDKKVSQENIFSQENDVINNLSKLPKQKMAPLPSIDNKVSVCTEQLPSIGGSSTKLGSLVPITDHESKLQ